MAGRGAVVGGRPVPDHSGGRARGPCLRGVGAEFESVQDEAGFGLWTYFVAVLAYIGAGAALVVRRFARVSA